MNAKYNKFKPETNAKVRKCKANLIALNNAYLSLNFVNLCISKV